MAYATAGDIENYTPVRAPFTGSSVPNASQVGVMIADVTSEVEMELVGAGYVVPIPQGATAAFAMVANTVKKGAAAMVERIAPTSRDRDPSMRLYTAALKLLKVGQLPDYPKGQPDARPRQGISDSASPMFVGEMQL